MLANEPQGGTGKASNSSSEETKGSEGYSFGNQIYDYYRRLKEVNPRLLDLVRLDLAELHGCEVGMEKHSADLRNAGETEERIEAVKCWKTSDLFNPKERYALSFAEAITTAPEGAITKILLDQAPSHFSMSELVELVSEIEAVNEWNDLRLLSSDSFEPEASDVDSEGM